MPARARQPRRPNPASDRQPLLWLALGLALILQIGLHQRLPAPRALARDLGPAPPADTMRLLALGDAAALASALMLGIQDFDTQPGASIPWRELDYGNLTAWLRLVLQLQPSSQYALLCASRLYAEVPDPVRTRQMLDLVADSFAADPDHRWPWLAHAVVLARHRLHQPQLALQYAHLLRTSIRDPNIPHWVGQMEALALADLNEAAAARVLLGGLLASDSIQDAHERHFLIERLQALQPAASGQVGLESVPASVVISTGATKNRHQ